MAIAKGKESRPDSGHYRSWEIPIRNGLTGPTPGVWHSPMGTKPRYTVIDFIEGYLRVLTSGSHVVTVRDMKDPTNLLVATITWDAEGDVVGSFEGGIGEYVFEGPGTGMRFSVPTVGAGYQDCVITIWGRSYF